MSRFSMVLSGLVLVPAVEDADTLDIEIKSDLPLVVESYHPGIYHGRRVVALSLRLDQRKRPALAASRDMIGEDLAAAADLLPDNPELAARLRSYRESVPS